MYTFSVKKMQNYIFRYWIGIHNGIFSNGSLDNIWGIVRVVIHLSCETYFVGPLVLKETPLANEIILSTKSAGKDTIGILLLHDSVSVERDMYVEVLKL